MPVKGIERVRKSVRVTLDRLSGPVTEGAIYAVLSQGAAIADTMTPIDTSALVNSRYEPQITYQGKEIIGHVGYTAEYAAWVHDAPGVLRGEPRDPSDPSRGDFWDPNAEPEFLRKGFEELAPSVPRLLNQYYKV